MSISLLIVVPTLNSHHYLPRLLHSLQGQTWQHWRLLFVDGPSNPEHRQWLTSCCEAEVRCSWIVQEPSQPGIFGAMNQGFAQAAADDWVLFWGSDDWAASPHVLARAVASLKQFLLQDMTIDLLVCRGRYVSAISDVLARPSTFISDGLLSSISYRRALFLGCTPPHQATFFGPGVRRYLPRFASGFSLSADLDYFLQISRQPQLFVQCLDLELVYMSDAGISSQLTWRRLFEVRSAYRRAFGRYWWLAFTARYIRRTMSSFFNV